MFNLFKKKQSSLIAVADGRIIPLSEVPDEVFAQKLAGDGVAIIPESDIIVAPADGDLSMIFKTKHAFAMTLKDGAEILVHVGIDTVALNGEGFEALATEGMFVKQGTPILKINRAFIESKGLSLATPILLTNADNFSTVELTSETTAVGGKTELVVYKK